MNNQIFEGKFRILQTIGKGAFSTVYKVQRLKTRKIYALKKINLGELQEKEIQNSLNEIRILASVKNPYIVGFKEAFIIKDTQELCIIMDYAGGGDLSDKIKRCQLKNMRFPEMVVLRFFRQLCLALSELHDKNIVHRDLKTANIFMSEDCRMLKIGDMNVSKILKNTFAYTQTGTPYYASPEVWRDEPYDTKTDIWSLGCVMFEICMLRPPFKAQNMDELYSKVQARHMEKFDSFYSRDLQSCILRLLEPNPRMRPDCRQILKNKIFSNTSLQPGENDCFQELFQQLDLMETIAGGKNFYEIEKRLPGSQYSDKKENKNKNSSYGRSQFTDQKAQLDQIQKNAFKKKGKASPKVSCKNSGI